MLLQNFRGECLSNVLLHHGFQELDKPELFIKIYCTRKQVNPLRNLENCLR